MFTAVNVEDYGSYEQRILNMANDDKALTRFEFMQSLVRIAINKFVRTREVDHAGEALHRLIRDHLIPLLPPESTHDSDAFRRARLYTKEVHEMLVENQLPLRALFDRYASSSGEGSITAAPGTAGRKQEMLISQIGWETLMNDCSLLHDSSDTLAKGYGKFSLKHVKLAFIWSQGGI